MRCPADRSFRFAVAFLSGFALELFEGASGGAATFIVNQSYDAVDLVLADDQCDTSAAAGLQCTLRAAVQQARGTAEGDSIFLPSGTVFLSIPADAENDEATGDLDLWGDVEIYGSLDLPRSVIDTVDGWNDRLFNTSLPYGSQIRFFNIEMRGGKVARGGALYLNSDYVSIEYCVFTDNEATVDGGAIYITSGEVTLVGSSLIANHAWARAGGLFHSSSAVTLVDRSLIAGNTAGENAGGIYVSDGFSMTNSTVSGNATNGSGGGVWVFDGNVELRNVSIVGNVANFDADDNGGAGGIVLTGGTTTITNSIVADNVAFENPYNDCWGQLHTLVSGGWTLLESPCQAYDAAPSDLNGIDPELAPLANNGGPTKTHRPRAGSPVLDRGNPAVPGSEPDACAAVDQRNAPRPLEGTGFGVPRCDLGAVEFDGYLFADDFESGDDSQWD